MSITLSSRVERIKPSATLVVANRAAQLKAAGHDIIDLSVGEPDFDTPDFIKEAAIQAIHEGFTKYTAVEGIPALKNAIIEKFAQENQLNYRPEQIIVSSGAKQSLYNLFAALLNAGDEVIIPAPYWVSYPEMVLLTDGVPIIIDAGVEQRFKISAAQLEAAITPKTRLFIINSPSNPSGMAYTRQELEQLAAVLLKHPQICIVTDDIYEHIFWGKEPFLNIVNACSDLKERTLVVNGVSKAYAMTGWRIGYAAGPVSLVSAMKKVQSQSTSNPNSIAQKAAQAGISGNQSFVHEMNQEFKRRHDYLVGAINAIPGLACLSADGAFYAFVSAKKILEQGKFPNDLKLAEHLLNEAQVAVVPGSAFGSEGFLRLSYATAMESLQKAVERIKKAV